MKLHRTLASALILAGTLLHAEQKPVTSDPLVIAHGGFTVTAPVIRSMGGRVDVTNNSVLFLDDFGRFFRIDFDPLSPAELKDLESGKLKEEALLREAVVSYYFGQVIKPNLPEAKIVHEEPIASGGSKGYFAAIFLPGGSTYSINGKHMDIRRAIFAFRNGGYIYWLQTQETLDITGQKPAPDLPTALKDLRKAIDTLRNNMKFP